MDRTEELIREYWQTAQEKGYDAVRAEALLALACSPEAEALYGSLEAAVSALLRLCRECGSDAECFDRYRIR